MAAARPPEGRSVVDYAMARRATLAALRGGGLLGAAGRHDACDAHPDLLRAARFHGEPTDEVCPVCGRERLLHLTYVYGDELGQYSGRIRRAAELPRLAREHGELTAYVVEVCRGCSWNHLALSFVIGDGVPRRPPRRQHTVDMDD